MKEKKKKQKYVDDGHTIYDMNVEGMRGYRKPRSHIYVDKDDKRAMQKAALLAYMPILIVIIAGFLLAGLLLYLWLS